MRRDRGPSCPTRRAPQGAPTWDCRWSLCPVLVQTSETPEGRHGRRKGVRGPSLRIVLSVGPQGVLMSRADRIERFVLLLAAAVVTALFGGACQSQEVGEMQRESRTIQPQSAQSVRANLMMGSGELQVVGAADALMEADFSYNVGAWKPKVIYQVAGNTGELSVKQGSGGGVRL